MAKDFELNFRDILRIIRRRKRTVILFLIFVPLVFNYQLSKKKPIYKSTATIKIEQRKNVGTILSEWVSWSPTDEMKTAAETIKTFFVGKQACIKMGLIDEESSASKIENVVGEILGSIETEVIPNTDLIKITATSFDPDKAKNIAQAISEAYIEFVFLEETKYAQQMKSFIEEELKTVEEKLTSDRKELKSFIETHGIPYSSIGITGVSGSSIEGLSSFSSTKTPEISLMELQKQLVDKKTQLLSLLSRYTKEHPKVKMLKKEVERIESEINSSFKKFSSNEEEFSKLFLNVKVSEELYTLFTKKLAEAKILESSVSKSVTIVNPPQTPSSPSYSQRGVGTIASGIIGLILGCLLAFIQENLDTSLGTVEEVEEFMNLPVLGIIPSIQLDKTPKKFFFKKIKTEEKSQSFLFPEMPSSSPIEEMYTILSTNIDFAIKSKKGVSILFTSVTFEEGKTTVASNCALSMAKSRKKVLLIDSDLRKPDVHTMFKIDREKGLSDLILGTITKENSIKGLEHFLIGGLIKTVVMTSSAFDTLKVITAGHIPTNPIPLLDSIKFKNILEEFKNEYDILILDSPPLLPVADSLILATKVDYVVIVYQAGRISRVALRRAKLQLEKSGANIIGIVVNNIKAEEIEPGPAYYYYYGQRKKS